MVEAVTRPNLHRFCPRCGAAAIDRRSDKLVVCGTCGLELYFNPCAAVAAIVLDANDRVLLVRRSHEPAQGMLAFPGGYVDAHETAEAALRREIAEETGLTVDMLAYLSSHPNTYLFEGVIYHTLDGVDRILTTTRDKLQLDDLAFESMKAAWRVFLAKMSR